MRSLKKGQNLDVPFFEGHDSEDLVKFTLVEEGSGRQPVEVPPHPAWIDASMFGPVIRPRIVELLEAGAIATVTDLEIEGGIERVLVDLTLNGWKYRAWLSGAGYWTENG